MTWTPFSASSAPPSGRSWSPFGAHLHETASGNDWLTPGGLVQGAWVQGGMPTPGAGAGAVQTGGAWVGGGMPTPTPAESDSSAQALSAGEGDQGGFANDPWLLGAHNTGQVSPEPEPASTGGTTQGAGPDVGPSSTGMGPGSTPPATTEEGCTTPNLWDADLGQCLTWDEQMERIKLQNDCTRLGQLFDKKTKTCVAQSGVPASSGPCDAPNRVWIATGECIGQAEQERRAKLNFDCGDRGGIFDATNLSCRMAGEGDDASGGGTSGAGGEEKKSILPWVVGLAAVGAAIAVGVYVMNQPAANAAMSSEG